MIKLVLLRHGQSSWNLENRFTGWTDVDLSPQGVEEARAAGKLLRAEGYTFDRAHASVLKRAIRTLWLVLEEMDLMWLPCANSWQLNEKHYGALQGANKKETVARYGAEQVQIWRRSYDIPAPPLAGEELKQQQADPRYRHLPPVATEALRDTQERVLQYWHSAIAPSLRQGERLLVAAHGNSLRALVQYLEQLSASDILALNIPTGIPLVYELDAGLTPLRHYYLGDPARLRAAIATVAGQTK